MYPRGRVNVFSRRRLLGIAGITGVGAFLVACGSPGPSTATVAPAKEAAPPTAAPPSPAPAKPTTQPAAAATQPAATAPAAAKPATPSAPTPLRVVLFGAPDRAESYRPAQGRFKQAFPSIGLEFTAVQAGEWEEFLGKVITMVTSGQVVDLCDGATDSHQLFAAKGMSVPIDQYVMADKAELQEYFDDVAPALIEHWLYQGKLYSLNWLFGPALVFYNAKLFKELGIERPKDDWTKEDFLAIAKKVTEAKPGTYGFGWSNLPWAGLPWWGFVNDTNVYTEVRAPGGDWFWRAFYPNNKAAQGKGGGWVWEQPKFNDERNVEALQFLQDLTWVHKAAPVPTSRGEIQNFFAQGKVAMMLSHRYSVGLLKNSGWKEDEFDILPPPKWRSQRAQFGTNGFMFLKDAKAPEAAWQFMKFMVRKEETDAWVKGGIHSSPRRSVALDPKQHEGLGPKNYRLFYEVVDNPDKYPNTSPFAAPPETREMTTLLTKYIGLAMANEMKPKEALDKLQADLLAVKARTKP